MSTTIQILPFALIIIGLVWLAFQFIPVEYINPIATILGALITVGGIWLGYQIDQDIKSKNAIASLAVDYQLYTENMDRLLIDVKPLLDEMEKNKLNETAIAEKIDDELSKFGIFYRIENDTWATNKHIFIKELSKNTYKEINDYINKIANLQFQIDMVKENKYSQQAKKAEYVIQNVVEFSKKYPVSREFTEKMIEIYEGKNTETIEKIYNNQLFTDDKKNYLLELWGFLFRVSPEGYAYRPLYRYLELHNTLKELEKNSSIEKIKKELKEKVGV